MMDRSNRVLVERLYRDIDKFEAISRWVDEVFIPLVSMGGEP